jgi:hypothetical protein
MSLYVGIATAAEKSRLTGIKSQNLKLRHFYKPFNFI